MDLEFGTDGVRGVANSELTPEFVVRLGRVAGEVLGAGSTRERPICVVGIDTRASGEMLSAALAAGLNSAGVDVELAGVAPAAGVALVAGETGADFAAVVSASHNPASDNGVKFFARGGRKLSGADERRIEELLGQPDSCDRPTGGDVGRISHREDYSDRFAEILLSTVMTPLDGIRIAIDAGNGAAYSIGPDVLMRAGAEVTVINARPNGVNINLESGATHPQSLAETVAAGDFDIGVAFDGDADRMIPIDEKGNVLDGDHILAICAGALAAEGRLDGDAVVATVMSNVGLRLHLESIGVDLYEAAVGDRNVLEMIEDKGLALGGEQSGHIIFRDLSPTGDGLLTCLQVCQILKRSDLSLSQLAGSMRVFPQQLANVPLPDRRRLDGATDFWNTVAAAEDELGAKGRVVVRPSGTEPKLRIMVQAESIELVERHVNAIAAAVEAI